MNFDVEKYRVNFLIMERSASVNDGLDYSGDAAAGSFFSTDYKRSVLVLNLGHTCYDVLRSKTG